MPVISSILIVGAGISGLSLAIGLARIGIRVHIVEREREVRVAGVGIILQGPTLRAFKMLGVLDAVLSQGFPYSNGRMLDADGHDIGTRPMSNVVGPGYPAAAGIPRHALADVLTEEALRLGATIQYDASIQAMDNRPDAIGVHYTDGQRGEFDLVVGCDGLHSTVRQILFGDSIQPTYTGQGVWRFMSRRDARVTTSSRPRSGRYPIGIIPLSHELMYLYLLENDPAPTPKDPAQLHHLLRERMTGYGSFIDEIRDQITAPEQVNFRSLRTLMLPAPWYRGRGIVIGDAVHTMTPHLASGAAMAAEDSLVLTELLSNALDLDTALEQFMQRRFERARFTLEASVQIGRWQIEGAPIDYEGYYAKVREPLNAPP
jgi:2-polyprenyl-6-methoxyphenol hydroxylase-like FAD-dependent oxidoreductase